MTPKPTQDMQIRAQKYDHSESYHTPKLKILHVPSKIEYKQGNQGTTNTKTQVEEWHINDKTLKDMLEFAMINTYNFALEASKVGGWFQANKHSNDSISNQIQSLIPR